MMKRGFNMVPVIAAFLTACLASCVNLSSDDPHEPSLCKVLVQLTYPAGYESYMRKDVSVIFEEINNGYSFAGLTDDFGLVSTRLPKGLYRVNVSDRSGIDIFNGAKDKVVLDGKDAVVYLPLKYSKAGTLVIKEIYCGGCKKLPEDGDYQADKYMILHNNDDRTIYLDSLCFGTLAPYNSNSANPWNEIMDFAPVIQAVWQFPGDGKSFPLEAGSDAVVCFNGAIDHTVTYPLSVNLNNPEYFACYNTTYFTNAAYHPAPGDKIKLDHILNVVIKTGQANAYTVSRSSPAVVIFRPVGTTIEDFLKTENSVIQIPGSAVDRVVTVPWEWVVDGVEVFNGSSSNNNKRVREDVDAGYISQASTYMGYSMHRKVDEQATADKGYEVLADTNNSSSDFVQLEHASLYKAK